MLCSSAGRSSGNLSSDSGSDVLSSVDGGGGVVSEDVGVAMVRLKSCGILGSGIVNSGFFVRMIRVVVAMYNDGAASSNMPNTKPGNPRRRACARCCHCWALKMLNLNKKYNNAHVATI